jgi:polar amino acid transport system ATP-binding protein
MTGQEVQPATVEERRSVVSAEGVRKSFGSVEVLKGIDLEVREREVLCLIGPSGSGKSTFLRCINHLERVDGGLLRVDGELVGYREKNGKLYELREKEVAERRRGIGMVFQRFNLFPHMTAEQNVMEAPVQVLGENPKEVRERARQLLHRVGLGEKFAAYPRELSGGQQQRVAIARALAGDRPLLLLDEPFAALDALTRERLQEDVRGVSERTGNTSVFVTHSVDEAVFLASRVVVLTQAPGTVALDVPVDLPRGGISADDLRGLPEYASLRAEIGAAVRSVAS